MTRKIAFLGCGSMGEAILAGLLGAGQSPSAVTVTVRRTERAAELAARHQVTAIAATEEPEANSQAAKGADVVVLGVKPLGIAALCREIAPALSAGTVVISIAAAVSLEQLAAALPDGQPVVRSMPNTPLRVGRGVVALSAGPSVSAGQLALARGIFSGAGTVLEVPEEQQNAVSAISGSGPAYMFYLAESLAAAARDLGLDADMALVLAKETVAGAGLMLAQEGADPTELRRAVTSPNGTTERAIATFEDRGLPAIIGAGARAAADRAAAITEELG